MLARIPHMPYVPKRYPVNINEHYIYASEKFYGAAHKSKYMPKIMELQMLMSEKFSNIVTII